LWSGLGWVLLVLLGVLVHVLVVRWNSYLRKQSVQWRYLLLFHVLERLGLVMVVMLVWRHLIFFISVDSGVQRISGLKCGCVVHHNGHLCGTLAGSIDIVGLAVQLVGLVKHDEVN
jgi:hypothetical protein